MKLVLQILVSLLLHPIAMVLMVINVVGRDDLKFWQKIGWTVVTLAWGIGPIIYITLGGGSLW